jgi:acetyltransferase-like isoleucine patch superfamily enzyme
MRPVDLIGRALLRAYGYILLRRKIYAHGFFWVANPRNVAIGRNCSINHGVYILGRNMVNIGNDVVLSARCMLIDAGLDPETFRDPSGPSYRPSTGIVVEDGAWIGAGAILLPGVTVGRKAIVGAGSVVTKSVPAGVVVAGNPARQIASAKA